MYHNGNVSGRSNMSSGVLEVIVPILFLVIAIIMISFQCGHWCRKNHKDPQDVLNKSVDLEEGMKNLLLV